jgi:hypothetical protein
MKRGLVGMEHLTIPSDTRDVSWTNTNKHVCLLVAWAGEDTNWKQGTVFTFVIYPIAFTASPCNTYENIIDFIIGSSPSYPGDLGSNLARVIVSHSEHLCGGEIYLAPQGDIWGVSSVSRVSVRISSRLVFISSTILHPSLRGEWKEADRNRYLISFMSSSYFEIIITP